MKFYLMRHGEAEYSAPSDAERKLTHRGIELLKVRLAAAKAQFNDVSCIIHSPYLRALGTAQVVSESLNVIELISSDLWTPESDAQKALSSLENYTDQVPLVVTHMPVVSYVEALCCDGDFSFPRSFSCGEISAITAEWPAVGLGTRLAQF